MKVTSRRPISKKSGRPSPKTDPSHSLLNPNPKSMNRRHFLSTSAFAGTFSLLSPLARAQGANGDARIAIIGFNSRGKNLLDQVLKAKGARVVALCDVDSG